MQTSLFRCIIKNKKIMQTWRETAYPNDYGRDETKAECF